ncbi:MAG: aminoacetone oxidase family FAD-binding enzyme, partial [Eubacteriales bacterium]|nr:aminoacetone oxidase family FAD-binding enzyme [Eubacteriales bacterium]
YPSTGSTGDGYSIAAGCGHTIIRPKPSLVPLITSEDWPASVEGLSLKNINVRFTDPDGRLVFSDFGEMMFTGFGVTGPVILSAGHHLAKLGYSNIRLHIDLKPALDVDMLDKRIARDFLKNSRKYYRNSLDDLLPSGLIPVIISLSEIDPIKKVNQISKVERKRLTGLLKDLSLTIKAPGSLSEAIITAGGVVTDEINPATMESKIVKGLFFAGEVIDVDGYTGGYNLSAAFSTGYTAGSFCY